MPRTIAELEQRLILLETFCKQLEARQQWVERIFEAYGVRGLWLSPGQAAPLLGISRDRIMTEIDRAEQRRISGGRGDLTYGIHYRNIQDPDAGKAAWQVHVAKFDEVLVIPPDRRRVG